MNDKGSTPRNEIWADLADTLWGAYPGRTSPAELQPSETFPQGTLLGRYRLDPLDGRRTDGAPTDLMAGEGGPQAEGIRRQLQERALRAATTSDAMIDAVLDTIERQWDGRWDQPWQLYGLVPPEMAAAADSSARHADGGRAGAVVLLVPEGEGHPGEGLTGMIAPPPVFGLVLVNEGYQRDDNGQRIGEIRMQIVALADGRWGFQSVSRTDSPWKPRPDSTVGGKIVDGDMLRGHVREPFGSGRIDQLAGVVPETLARVLQVAVQPGVDPREIMLRILARAAVVMVQGGAGFADLARADAATVAAVSATVLAGLKDPGTAALPDPAKLVASMAEQIETLRRKAQRGGEWLDDTMLSRVDAESALRSAAGAFRVGEGIDDTTAAWLGSELLAGRAGEMAGPVSESLAQLARHNKTVAEQLAKVISHRRDVWGIEDDGRGLAAVMSLGAKPRRNDPCPCGSGRKVKHCCGRAGQ